MFFGLIFGLIGASFKFSRFFIIRAIAEVFTTILRGLPELVIILFIYYGSAIILGNIGTKFGYDGFIGLNTFVAGAISLSSIFGAYATDIFRVAFLSIPIGQIEAGYATGMSRLLILWRISLPQVWRLALPGLSNLTLGLMKNTSLVAVIGLYELMGNASLAVSHTKKPFIFYTVVALIYLILTSVTMIVLQKLESITGRGYERV